MQAPLKFSAAAAAKGTRVSISLPEIRVAGFVIVRP
jgi:hypothetical protein